MEWDQNPLSGENNLDTRLFKIHLQVLLSEYS